MGIDVRDEEVPGQGDRRGERCPNRQQGDIYRTLSKKAGYSSLSASDQSPSASW
jgi:hypothetical protein